MSKFKVGDVVYINSTPEIKLTVTYLEPNQNKDFISLTYFNQKENLMKLGYMKIQFLWLKINKGVANCNSFIICDYNKNYNFSN